MLAAGVAAGVGQLVSLGPVDPALVGEEQDPVMSRGDEEVVHDVVGAQLRAADPLAASPLRAVQVGLGALGVPAVGDRDRDVLFGDQVLVGHLAVVGDDLGAPLIPVLGHDLGQLGTDDLPLPLRRGQDVLVVGDLGFQLVVLVDEFLPLQGGQLAELHVQDRAGLDLVDLEQPHQALLGLGGRRAGPDQRDDLVDPVDGLEQCGDDVQPLLSLAQPVPGAPDDDLDLVCHPVPDHLVQTQGARHAVDQRQHVGAERVLQLGVLVQVVEHHLGDGVPLQHDDQPLPGPAAGLVLDVGDAADPAVPDQLGDLLRQVVRIDLVGQFLDDQAGAAAGVFLDLHDSPHDDRAAPGTVGVPDAAPAHDQAAGREVGSLDPLHQRVEELLSPTRRSCSRYQATPAATSRRLCGGILVAMPTAIPSDPLISRLGNRLGSTTGSDERPS